MLPTFHIFGIHIATYALMVFLGVCAYVVTYFCIVEKGEKIDKTTSNRLLFVSLIGVICLYIFAYLFNSLYHSIETHEVKWGGITWLGGVLGSFPVILLCIHWLVPKARGNAVYYFSLIIPGIVIGHAFGRLGCFFGGCCYGKPTSSWLGVVFPAGSSAAKLYPNADGSGSLPVYPTQLFEALFEFVLFFVMIIGRKKFKKYNLAIYLSAYGVFRFLIEYLRGDDRGEFVGSLTPSQWSCIIIVIAAIFLILFQNKRTFPKLIQKCESWQETARKTPVVVMGKRGGEDNIAMLRELQGLLDDGIITEEEFAAKKAELLKRI
jgi:phosphatidylglycerol:prolipoprotein diacylglycerol transferase